MASPSLLDIDAIGIRRLVDGRAGAPVGADLSIAVGHGEIHALITEAPASARIVASALVGGPDHAVTSGPIRLRGDDITDWAPDVRAKVGLMLARRGPRMLPELTPVDLVRAALAALRGRGVSTTDARSALALWATRLDIDPESALVEHNDLLQMAVLEPDMVVVDTTGLEPDEVQTFISAIRLMQQDRPAIGALFLLTDPSHVARFDASRVHRLDGTLRDGPAEHDPADNSVAFDPADRAEIAAASEDGR